MDPSILLKNGIAVFPDFIDIDLGMKPYFDGLLTLQAPLASEYTFTNIFIWRHLYRFRACSLDGALCIKGVDRSGVEFLMIVAKDTGAYVDTVQRISDRYRRESGTVRLFRVEERFVEPLKRTFPAMTTEDDRDNSDYVYLSSDLIDLKGRKYDGKRNHIKRFRERYTYDYAPITDALRDECVELTEVWHKTKGSDGIEADITATREAITNFGPLGLTGGVIRIDGKVRAFSIAERLNAETAVIHIEKYDPSYEGLAQVMNQQLCSQACSAFKYINREQDMGIQGLRRSKLSYNPAFLLNKYKIIIGP